MKQCYICTQQKEIDWKDADLLRRFMSPDNRILKPRATGTCSKHQRQIAKAIKRARVMSVVPYAPMIEK